MSGWISIKNAMPASKSVVDVWLVDKWSLQANKKYRGERVINMLYMKSRGFDWTEESRYPQSMPFDNDFVTHWMEKPKPPEIDL